MFIRVTHALVHDVNLLAWIVPEAGSFYIMDRAYIDYARLYRIHQASAFSVAHARKSFRFKQLYSRPVDKSTGLRCDQTVKLTSFYPLKAHPEKLRRIRFVNAETGKRFILITNCLTLPAFTITQIWIAIFVYVLVAILKKRLQIDQCLYTILQILSVTLFKKTPILRALSHADYTIVDAQNRNQLMLFDL